MKIISPFELLELNKKQLITKIKEEKYQYKIKGDIIKFTTLIDGLSLLFEVEIICLLNKISSVNFTYSSDLSTKDTLIEINNVKKFYKDNFELKNHFDTKDAKSFWYSFIYDDFTIYMIGTGEYSTNHEKVISINYRKKHNETYQKNNKEPQKLTIKASKVQKLSKVVSDNKNVWYGIIHNIVKAKQKKNHLCIELDNDKITLYELNKHKIKREEIYFNNITNYNFNNDIIGIFCKDKKNYVFTVLQNDINKLDSIIKDKIGYNSKKYNELNRIIKEAFYEYNPFGILSKIEEKYEYLVHNLTKNLFVYKELNNDIIYENLNGLDFDMYFYIEWTNFANFLYEKLKENYIN